MSTCRATEEPVAVRELGMIDYREAWAVQHDLAAARADGTGPDTLLLLEHPPVYTAGRRTTKEEKPTDGTPVVDVDRGGKITYHAPGQIVGYPIVKLADPIDVVDYVRRLEQAMIAVCDRLGVSGAGRVAGRSGVWLPAGDGRPERKLGAIGVRVQRGVTLHGLALNCDVDLAGFATIIPCGITDAGVGSLSAELGRTVTVAEVLPLAAEAILAALDGTLPRTERTVAHTPAVEHPNLRMVLST